MSVRRGAVERGEVIASVDHQEVVTGNTIETKLILRHQVYCQADTFTVPWCLVYKNRYSKRKEVLQTVNKYILKMSIDGKNRKKYY